MQSVFKALSDPTRREILRALSRGSLSAGRLAERFPISRASLSHHFNVLKAADLVRDERRGQSIVYSLNTSIVEELMGAVLGIFNARDDVDAAAAGDANTDTEAEADADADTRAAGVRARAARRGHKETQE